MFRDIINDFPNFEMLRKNGGESYQRYLLEEELKSILRTLLWGVKKDFYYVYISEISDAALSVIKDKGYVVTRDKNNADSPRKIYIDSKAWHEFGCFCGEERL